MTYPLGHESSELYISAYADWLSNQPLSDNTKRAYLSRIRQFFLFLEYGNVAKQSLTETMHLYLEFSRKTQRGARSINAYINALNHFSRFVGLKPLSVKRERSYAKASGVLTVEEQQRFLKSIGEQKRSRDKSIALLLLYSGLRISDFANLDISNVSAGISFIEIAGKCKIPLNQPTRQALREWCEERTKVSESSGCTALWLTEDGKRLSPGGLTYIVERIGWQAGLLISPELLRRTCLATTVESSDSKNLAARFGGYVSASTIARFRLSTRSL